MSRCAKFVHIDVGGKDEFMLVKTVKPNSLNIDEPLFCPVCKSDVTVAMEVMQYGFWKDTFTLLLVCQGCNVAYWYSFSSEYESGDEGEER